MKHSLLYLLIASSLLAGQAQADGFALNGKTYQVMKMGRSIKVVPAEGLRARILPVTDQQGYSCNEIADTIARREDYLKDCQENPQRSVCKILATSLRILADGRPDSEESQIDPSAVRAWQAGAPEADLSDAAAVREAVASKYGLRPSRVELLMSGARPRLASGASLQLGAGSLYGKVASFLGLHESPVQVGGDGRILTRNRILACDLEAGRAALQVSAESTVKSVDRVPEIVLDAAWNVSKALDQAAPEIEANPPGLLQAAAIGYFIGRALPAELDPEEPLLHIGALFTRLYSWDAQNPSELTRKTYASREELREEAYPDEAFEAKVQQGWVLQ